MFKTPIGESDGRFTVWIFCFYSPPAVTGCSPFAGDSVDPAWALA